MTIKNGLSILEHVKVTKKVIVHIIEKLKPLNSKKRHEI